MVISRKSHFPSHCLRLRNNFYRKLPANLAGSFAFSYFIWYNVSKGECQAQRAPAEPIANKYHSAICCDKVK